MARCLRFLFLGVLCALTCQPTAGECIFCGADCPKACWDNMTATGLGFEDIEACQDARDNIVASCGCSSWDDGGVCSADGSRCVPRKTLPYAMARAYAKWKEVNGQPTDETACPDTKSQWMIDNGKECSSWGWMLTNKCNKDDDWVRNQYCARTCAANNVGYAALTEACQGPVPANNVHSSWIGYAISTYTGGSGGVNQYCFQCGAQDFAKDFDQWCPSVSCTTWNNKYDKCVNKAGGKCTWTGSGQGDGQGNCLPVTETATASQETSLLDNKHVQNRKGAATDDLLALIEDATRTQVKDFTCW